jgi:hypothetical protein
MANCERFEINHAKQGPKELTNLRPPHSFLTGHVNGKGALRNVIVLPKISITDVDFLMIMDEDELTIANVMPTRNILCSSYKHLSRLSYIAFSNVTIEGEFTRIQAFDIRDGFLCFRKTNPRKPCPRRWCGFKGNWMIYTKCGDVVAKVDRFCSSTRRLCHDYEGDYSILPNLFSHLHDNHSGIAITAQISDTNLKYLMVISYRFVIAGGRLKHSILEIIWNKSVGVIKFKDYRKTLRCFKMPGAVDIITLIHSSTCQIYHLQKSKLFKKKEILRGRYPSHLYTVGFIFFDKIANRMLFMSHSYTRNPAFKSIQLECNVRNSTISDLLEQRIDVVKELEEWSLFTVGSTGDVFTVEWREPRLITIYRTIPDLF